MSVQNKIIISNDIIEIRRNIKKSIHEISFISFVISTWHFDNLIAYLNCNNITNGILIVAPQNDVKDSSKFRLHQENFEPYASFFYKIIFFNSKLNLSFDVYSALSSLIPRRKKTLLFINPGRPYLKLILSLHISNRSINFVSIDEGLGTYVPSSEFNEFNMSFTKKISKQISHKFVDILTSCIVKHFYDFHFYIKNSKINILIPNSKVCNMLYNIYTERNPQIIRIQKVILIFKDFEFINSEFSSNLFSEILSLLSTYNLKIIIKKHPNDIQPAFNDFIGTFQNAEIINTNKSGEELVAVIRPDFIIGGFSTVAFSSSFIYNCRVVSYMLLYKNTRLPPVMESQIDFFFHNFNYNENLKFPSTIAELLFECKKSLNYLKK